MLPHRRVHGRRRQHRCAGGEQHAAGEILGAALRHGGEAVGAGRHHGHALGPAREADVADLALGRPQVVGHRLAE
jgi:hypothetical protein